MKRRVMSRGLWAAAIGLMMTGGADAANIVTNGDFETGTYADWVQGGDTRFMSITSTAADVHSGTYAAQFSGLGDNAVLSQTLTTSIGTEYQLTYWLKGDGGTPNDFSVNFAGQTLFSQSNIAAFGYKEFAYDVIASSSSSTLQFAAHDDPGYFYLDAVSVVAVSAVPEPSTLLMGTLGTLFVGGCVARNRRRSAVV